MGSPDKHAGPITTPKTQNLSLEATGSAKQRAHAIRLTQQSWEVVCDRMEHSMGVAWTWNTLRSLLDPEGRKTTQQNNFKALMHSCDDSDEQPLRESQRPYVCSATHPLPKYTSSPNPELDSPLTVSEVRAGARGLRRKSGPGPDKKFLKFFII